MGSDQGAGLLHCSRRVKVRKCCRSTGVGRWGHFLTFHAVILCCTVSEGVLASIVTQDFTYWAVPTTLITKRMSGRFFTVPKKALYGEKPKSLCWAVKVPFARMPLSL